MGVILGLDPRTSNPSVSSMGLKFEGYDVACFGMEQQPFRAIGFDKFNLPSSKPFFQRFFSLDCRWHLVVIYNQMRRLI